MTVYLESGSTLTSNDLGVDESKIVSCHRWNEDNLTWTLGEDGTLTISGTGAMKNYNSDDNRSPVYNNSNVKKIVVEKGVTSIGEMAFYNCSSLKSIIIPNGVTSIEFAAFYKCSSLSSITIPDSVTSIGYGAFNACSSLTIITIPKSVTSIGSGVFHNCNDLTVYLESGSTLTSNDLGVDESKIVSYHRWNEDNLTWMLGEDGTLIISGTGAMKEYDYSANQSPVYNNSSVKKVVIEYGVTSIGDSAFYSCEKLTSITIPDSVTSIGDSAFSNCESLTAISLSCKSSLKRSDFGDQADLVSYTSHTLKKTEAKDATCTEDGNIEYWTCEHCKKYFLSDDTNPETAKAVEQSETVIPASHKLTKVEAKAATCTENGNKEYWTCEHCGKYFLSDDTNPETAKAVEQAETDPV